METLFSCPVCRKALFREAKRMVCAEGHSFDIAKDGFVNLLLRQKGGTHGDNREMLLARRNFLSQGYYEPLAKAAVDMCAPYLRETPSLLDAGCGEGYYAAYLDSGLRRGGSTPHFVCIDISREALRLVARRLPSADKAVAGLYDLPLRDGSFDCVFCFFSPLVPKEFSRVLREGGIFLMAVPGRRHLFALKEILYEKPYENRVEDSRLEGFSLLDERRVYGKITVEDQDNIHALFGMTPYYYRTPKTGHDKVAALEELETEIEFHLFLYRKK